MEEAFQLNEFEAVKAEGLDDLLQKIADHKGCGTSGGSGKASCGTSAGPADMARRTYGRR